MTATADSEVMERLIRIETKLDFAVSRSDDHETRLRALEARRWPLPVISAITAVAGTPGLFAAIYVLFKGGSP